MWGVAAETGVFQTPRKLGRRVRNRKLAERVGFEPTVGGNPTTVFETAAFDHSATSPIIENKHFLSPRGKKKVSLLQKLLQKLFTPISAAHFKGGSLYAEPIVESRP